MTAAAEDGPQGVQFPADASGERRTMPVNRAIWADAARAADHRLATTISDTADWRGGYVPQVRAVTELGARSASTAGAVAAAGLESARSRLVFRRHGVEHRLSDAPDLPAGREVRTETITGTGDLHRSLVVPYRGEQLTGDRLRRQVSTWVEDGTIEPSAGVALEAVLEHPEWLRLDGRQIALLGAGAETSPLEVLASWGADVLALDLPRPRLWNRVLELASRGAGTVRVPVRPGSEGIADRAGLDLIAEVPEAARWLEGFAAEARLLLGFYVYADGPLHVQATMAADALADHLVARDHLIGVAYAGTPSDCYLVPPDVVEDSVERRRHRGLRAVYERPVRAVSGGKLYADAYPGVLTGADGERWAVADALVGKQGPNYALAKRLQRWRAVDSWTAGREASFNVAPPAWTVSVTKNRLLAAGYHGARAVGMEVFAPETMRTLMTALLVHDLHVPSTAKHPDARVADAAVHGGYWRRPYEIRSTLTYSAVLGLPRAYAPLLKLR